MSAERNKNLYQTCLVKISELWLRPLDSKAGCLCVSLDCSQMGKLLLQFRATCAGGVVIVSECPSKSLDSIRTI
jgi:hypothetical protein